MYADLSRWTHDAEANRRRVVFQQGRVSLDADLNELHAIVLDTVRRLAADIAGPFGAAPFEVNASRQHFRVTGVDDEPRVGGGRYWVGGLLVHSKQDDTPLTIDEEGFHLVLLDAWERYVDPAQHHPADNPPIAEVALGTADTAGRTQVVWRIRTAPIDAIPATDTALLSAFDSVTGIFQPVNRGQLSAWAKRPTPMEDPCLISPEARYVGPENQLYRIEILRGGPAWSDPPPNDGTVGEFGEGQAPTDVATFVWSRDNGSVVYPVEDASGREVVLSRPARDDRTKLTSDDWVEIVDKAAADGDPLAEGRRLHRIERVDECEVELATDPDLGPDVADSGTILRRWDSRPRPGDASSPWFDPDTGSLVLRERTEFHLEDGVTIKFEPGGEYRQGDYWLVPARTATGDVEWPGPVSAPEPRQPHGLDHYYAPLAALDVNDDGKLNSAPTDLRRQFAQTIKPVLPTTAAPAAPKRRRASKSSKRT